MRLAGLLLLQTSGQRLRTRDVCVLKDDDKIRELRH